MTPFQIDVFIRSQNIRRKVICEAIGCTEAELSATINGLRKNYKIRKALANYFNKTVDQIFGKDHALSVEWQATQREQVA